MRDIKFRAITTNANVNHFVYGLPVKAVKTGIWLMQIIEGEFGWLKTEGIDPETIGQFTGLHDKNGKEIYEGDIISGGLLSEPCEVMYQESCGRYIAFGMHYKVLAHKFDQFEVMGNIHEATK